jgi:hypothetical protein
MHTIEASHTNGNLSAVAIEVLRNGSERMDGGKSENLNCAGSDMTLPSINFRLANRADAIRCLMRWFVVFDLAIRARQTQAHPGVRACSSDSKSVYLDNAECSDAAQRGAHFLQNSLHPLTVHMPSSSALHS